jgi:hypothetical protein
MATDNDDDMATGNEHCNETSKYDDSDNNDDAVSRYNLFTIPK